MTLTFNPLQAMVMTYSHAKVQDQQSDGSKDRVETNGQTDGGNRIASLANVVGKHEAARRPALVRSVSQHGSHW